MASAVPCSQVESHTFQQVSQGAMELCVFLVVEHDIPPLDASWIDAHAAWTAMEKRSCSAVWVKKRICAPWKVDTP